MMKCKLWLWMASGFLAIAVVTPLCANEIVLHNFGKKTLGQHPVAGVVRDSHGNLYGTTYYGGTVGWGTLYKISRKGRFSILQNFSGDNGIYPVGLTIDSSGNLYGATNSGGTSSAGLVYTVNPAGQETVLYSFKGNQDGYYPHAAPVRDSAGNLYLTTYYGGGAGTLNKVDPAGNETVLHVFAFIGDAESPNGSVVLDAAGNIYGTGQYGGANGNGAIYEFDTAGNQTVLHSFNGADGSHASSALIFDSAGNLYGTTPSGGGPGNAGNIFKLDPSGNLTILYSFTGGADGNGPTGSLVFDAAGNLYGTTPAGGASNAGVVYKLDPLGNLTVLYSFTGGTDGSQPNGNVTLDAHGNIYGVTYAGGTRGNGVVFKITP